SYMHDAAATMTADAETPDFTSAQCWTEENKRTIVAGGTQEDTSAASYSYDDSDGSGSGSNSESAPSPGPTTAPVVQFRAPGSAVVPQAQFGQLLTSPAVGAQPAIGQAATGGRAPGATAPVPVSINMQVVPATAAWAGATQQSAQQAVTSSVNRTAVRG